MTFQMILILIVLGITVFLFISNLLRVDVVAILVMIALPWLGLVEPSEAFSGFASSAVITIIAVMILAYGLDRSGVINRIIQPIIKTAGRNDKLMIALISATTALVSAFMPNVGATALFLPAMLRVTKATGIPASRLLMPMGFSALLGGNLTMVGSSPLLILNDLLRHAGQKQLGLFSATPIGILLVLFGILYFLFFGEYVLPKKKEKKDRYINIQQRLIETWRLPTTIFQCAIPAKSPLIGKTRSEIKMRIEYNLNLLAIADGNDVYYAPWRHTPFAAGQILAVLGDKKDFERFISEFKLTQKKTRKLFTRIEKTAHAGFAELIIPVKSPVAGKTMRELELRKAYGIEPIILLSGDREDRKTFSDKTLRSGSTLIVHGLWERIKAMADNINFVLVTPLESTAESGESKPIAAISCFIGAVALALSGFPIPLGFLTGAVAMILLRIVTIEEAYKAVDWKTVFLLAGLIPIGIAMDHTGAAAYIASHILFLIKNTHPVIILFASGILSTLFSLFMSNVTATVLLVPFAMIIGNLAGINPRGLALLVTMCASNGFLLPVHQVNALIMSPGGYENKDYIKAGGIMTVIYIAITGILIYLFYI